MPKVSPLAIYVAAVVFVGIAAGVLSTTLPSVDPGGLWEVLSFIVISLVLEGSGSSLRIQGKGSTSFIVYLCAAVLFGALWAGLIAAISLALSKLFAREPPVKVIFNAAQILIAVVFSLWIYHSLGGSLPPSFLRLSEGVSAAAVQRDFVLFFLLALVYFLVNGALVNGAISLSSNRSFSEVWTTNTRGVLGYDLGASLVALAMAWVFLWSREHWNFGSLGILLAVVPIAFVRKTYSMYRNLEATSQELLEIMVKAIEARDPYTSGHSERVARLSKVIAQEIGKMSSEEVEKIYKAALLHDVGKMYEEFAPLLRKEGKLTPEERELLQTHAIRSAELVAIVSDFKGTVLEAVRSHHERWDGRGYPNGIKGEEIPIGARIIMISDTIDAMTTDRPYRKALPPEIVIAELQKHRGSQFDPALVDLVLGSVVIRRLFGESGELSLTPRRTQQLAGIAGPWSKSSVG